jgi:hypothetical protein
MIKEILHADSHRNVKNLWLQHTRALGHNQNTKLKNSQGRRNWKAN